METLLTICMVVAGVALAIVIIGFLFWVAVVVGVVGLVAYGVAEATGLPFWGTFVAVAVIGGVGYLLVHLFD